MWIYSSVPPARPSRVYERDSKEKVDLFMTNALPFKERRAPGFRTQVPEVCVTRLSLYLRELTRLNRQQVRMVSSRQLAESLGLTDVQIRRDFNYFGQFGTSGRGYDVRKLHDRLTKILGVAGRTWNVALAGVGHLGSALLAYRGFRERGFLFRVAVDTDPRKIGQTIQGLTIASASQLAHRVRQQQIHIGLITVPVESAQTVCDQLIQGGVRAILNFAPIHLDVPASVHLRTVDLAVELESLVFYLVHPSPDTDSRKNSMVNGA